MQLVKTIVYEKEGNDLSILATHTKTLTPQHKLEINSPFKVKKDENFK